eukprot:gene5637-6506_t
MYNAVGLTFDWSFDPRTLATFDRGFVYNVMMDPHCHTTYSDGALTPEQNIQWHIANGYNAMVVTDHNTMDGAFVAQKIAREKYNDQIKVLVGMEWSNCRVHLNFIGINETVTPIKNPTDLDIQLAINRTHELGGIVVYNHRPWSYWSGQDTPTIEDFAAWGVDYFDVANTMYFDFQTLVYARNMSIPICTANDYHGSTDATGWTVFNIPNATYNSSEPVNAAYFTEEQLWDVMKAGKSSIIFQVTGTGYDTSYTTTYNPKGLYSFVDSQNCGDQTVTINHAEITSTVLWFIALFLTGEIFRAIVVTSYKLIKARRNRNKQQAKSRYDGDWEDFSVADTPLLNMNL